MAKNVNDRHAFIHISNYITDCNVYWALFEHYAPLLALYRHKHHKNRDVRHHGHPCSICWSSAIYHVSFNSSFCNVTLLKCLILDWFIHQVTVNDSVLSIVIVSCSKLVFNVRCSNKHNHSNDQEHNSDKGIPPLFLKQHRNNIDKADDLRDVANDFQDECYSSQCGFSLRTDRSEISIM